MLLYSLFTLRTHFKNIYKLEVYLMDQNLHLLYLLVSFSIVMQYGIEQFCCSDTRYTECTVLQIPSTQAFQYRVAMTMCVCVCVCVCVYVSQEKHIAIADAVEPMECIRIAEGSGHKRTSVAT